MYRTAAPGQPSAPDPCLVVPGEGLRGIWVGHAIPDEVLATFGDDAQIHRHATGDVFRISYDYTGSGAYEPDRSGNEARPSGFLFEYGLLRAISVGVYQSALYLHGPLRIGSRRSDVIAVLGPPCETPTYRGRPGSGDDIETLRYRWRGVELSVHDEGTVSSFVVFQTRRPR